jgi:Uri superfamily endonuclease
VKSDPGTYALFLKSSLSTEIQVGRKDRLRLKPGFYVYVGSAFGPGGVRARVARHFRKAKRHNWHIDFLRDVIDPVCAWCSFSSVRLEHEWACALSQIAGMSGIERFGCSDCHCNAHLFAYSRQAIDAKIRLAIGGAIEIWPYHEAT